MLSYEPVRRTFGNTRIMWPSRSFNARPTSSPILVSPLHMNQQHPARTKTRQQRSPVKPKHTIQASLIQSKPPSSHRTLAPPRLLPASPSANTTYTQIVRSNALDVMLSVRASSTLARNPSTRPHRVRRTNLTRRPHSMNPYAAHILSPSPYTARRSAPTPYATQVFTSTST
ncbi:uncharacterized protein SCHCODRAFT_02105684 [Schizophyllum commune H4-8]|uniref:uncharacterized protein n=1 Tax=Schizophyllum commune (strain H4-8 / FGSC 9210) TaxID=578458 RepID=UPI00215E9C24|nr:uncharacterized protein SCHCODRAFT_02105684 [Schizophyllum commune H4-8]KAI5885786.1 hypothetical protein SCHCODRAFT_02105684 [Schizophyllum commune H4-8]